MLATYSGNVDVRLSVVCVSAYGGHVQWKCGCDANFFVCTFIWWPRTVHVLPELAHTTRARRNNNTDLPDCIQFGTVCGHHINTPDNIETDAITSTFPHAPDFQRQ